MHRGFKPPACGGRPRPSPAVTLPPSKQICLLDAALRLGCRANDLGEGARVSKFEALKPALPILIGSSLMLTMAMGLRQSLGIFMPELTKDIGISVSDFTLAIAVQNLLWGVLQPVAGALSVRWGSRPLMLGGSVLYLLGLVLLATSHGTVGVVLGAGVAIGASMACTGPALAMAAAARPVSVAMRSAV